MDAAQTTIITTDAEVGFGLLFFYSSVVDAVATMVSALAMADVVAAITTVIAVNGLLFFLFSSAVVETMASAANFFTGVVSAAPSYIVNKKNFVKSHNEKI